MSWVSALQGGLRVFKFTDIEGSTRLWELYPDEMGPALARHDVIVRSCIETNGGSVFGLAGDGFKAVFDLPSASLSAADAIQRELAAEGWPDGVEIRVRIGVHVGRAESRDGEFFGSAVNRASRVMSAGHGGQVLISDTAKKLADQPRVTDLGVHRLKDLSAPEHIWQLDIEGASSSFPALRTLEESRSNLPVRPRRMIGREAELERIVGLVESHSIVTVCGPGGVGKTTLAEQAAAAVAHGYPDGVWLVELAGVEDPSAIAFQFLDAMRLGVTEGRTAAEAVVDAIADRQVMLVVDNCEHLRSRVGRLLAEIMAGCPNVRVIASSREPLVVRGEAAMFIEPLPVESPGQPAITLFVERALEANPELVFSQSDRTTVAHICERLDGLPLAIELAAGRMRASTLGDISERLNARFSLLRGRGVQNDRHATLYDTISFSHQLLEPDERILFDRLSVFVGSFSVAQAEAVCSDESLDRYEIYDLLNRLVERSMVVADLHGPKASYRLLQSLRDFAATELLDSGPWRERHAIEFSRWVSEIAPALVGPEEEVLLAELEAGWDNLRAAVSFAREEGNLGLLEALIAPLSSEALYRGRTEIREWSQAALLMGDDPKPSTLAVDTACASVQGAQESVVRTGSAYHAIATGDPTSVDPFATLMVGLALHLAGEPELALDLYTLVETQARGPFEVEIRAWGLLQQALLHTYSERPNEAAAAVERCRALIEDRQTGATVTIGFELVDTLRGLDSPVRTVERMSASVEIAERVRCMLIGSVSAMVMANARAALGDVGQAYLDAAGVLRRHASSRNFTALTQQLRRAATMLLRVDDHAVAVTILDYLEYQRAAEPNPGTARDLAFLLPVAFDNLTSEQRETAREQARELSQQSVVEIAAAALVAAAA